MDAWITYWLGISLASWHRGLYRALSKRLLLGMPKAVFGGAKDCFWVGKTVLLRIRQKKDKKTANQEMTLNVTEGTGLTIITASET